MSRNRISVSAAPDAVFDVLEDPYAYPRWVVGARRVRGVDADWPAIGSRFFHVLGTAAGELHDSSMVLEWNRPERVSLEVRFRPTGIARVEIDVTVEASGSVVTIVESPISGPISRVPRFITDPLLALRNALSPYSVSDTRSNARQFWERVSRRPVQSATDRSGEQTVTWQRPLTRPSNARDDRNKSGVPLVHNDYAVPEPLGGGTVTIRLHGNSEDAARRLNRTENVRAIPPSDPTPTGCSADATTPSRSTAASRTPLAATRNDAPACRLGADRYAGASRTPSRGRPVGRAATKGTGPAPLPARPLSWRTDTRCTCACTPQPTSRIRLDVLHALMP